MQQPYLPTYLPWYLVVWSTFLFLQIFNFRSEKLSANLKLQSRAALNLNGGRVNCMKKQKLFVL